MIEVHKKKKKTIKNYIIKVYKTFIGPNKKLV